VRYTTIVPSNDDFGRYSVHLHGTVDFGQRRANEPRDGKTGQNDRHSGGGKDGTQWRDVSTVTPTRN
jgi:hypothetical protein